MSSREYQASGLSLDNQWHGLIVKSPLRKGKTAMTVAHYNDSLLHFKQHVTVQLLTVFIWSGAVLVQFFFLFFFSILPCLLYSYLV